MLPGKRHRSDYRASSFLPRLGSSLLAPVFAGFVSKISSSSSLPSKLPPLVVRASVGVWTTSPDQSPGSGPFPRCCSRITACFPQCACKLFVSYSQPLPPQTGFPGSRHHCSHFSSLASALHRHFALALLLAVTPVESTSLVHVASRRSDSLRPC